MTQTFEEANIIFAVGARRLDWVVEAHGVENVPHRWTPRARQHSVSARVILLGKFANHA